MFPEASHLPDYEEPLAGGDVELRLHKYRGEWFVTGRTLGWVS
jgi:hypothetical protein